MAARGPQNGRRGLERCLSLRHSKQLSQNKFFNPSTPYMRKVGDGEKRKKRKKRKEWRFQWPLRHCQQSNARTTTPEQRPLERHTLVPIFRTVVYSRRIQSFLNFTPFQHCQDINLLVANFDKIFHLNSNLNEGQCTVVKQKLLICLVLLFLFLVEPINSNEILFRER